MQIHICFKFDKKIIQLKYLTYTVLRWLDNKYKNWSGDYYKILESIKIKTYEFNENV